MAQDIIQKLGFDASSAIAEITRLKGAMASLNSATEGLANKVNSFDATQANKGFGELQKGAKDAEKGFKDLTISWKTLLRVVTTRVALGAFNKLTEALKEGTQAAITFGIRIAEIGTIAGKGIDLSNIRKEILDISSLTGRDAADVAEGYYQTLSNQVGDATESLYVFKQAAKLSIATNSSLGDSVNLLTAALNGWQMSAYEARNATNQLFKIIELGRVRVKDLANILGSVGPMAAKLGVNFGELGGSLSHITVQGVRANKTITHLRSLNALSAFLAGVSKTNWDAHAISFLPCSFIPSTAFVTASIVSSVFAISLIKAKTPVIARTFGKNLANLSEAPPVSA